MAIRVSQALDAGMTFRPVRFSLDCRTCVQPAEKAHCMGVSLANMRRSFWYTADFSEIDRCHLIATQNTEY